MRGGRRIARESLMLSNLAYETGTEHSSMQISIIIPTYNRAAILQKTLAGYARQCGDHQVLEVLVLDDGSRDHTKSVVEECSRNYPHPLRYLHQRNRGLAAARNHGFREAQGELILFGDDDIIPHPEMVARHVTSHRFYPAEDVGIFGHVTWDSEVQPTPFMNWAGHYGPLLSVGRFTPYMELDFKFAVFGNTSVKTAFLREHGIFNERFSKYGWEDLELSYRLYQRGFRLRYDPVAVGYHHKFLTFEQTLTQMEALYSSWPTFAETEAGAQFVADWRKQKNAGGWAVASIVKSLLKPALPTVMPLFRRAMDMRIRLPRKLYEMVFFYYLTSFADVVAAHECAVRGLNRRLKEPDVPTLRLSR
jgi:glycosyltransferase involved in cell wall biosynthesis